MKKKLIVAMMCVMMCGMPVTAHAAVVSVNISSIMRQVSVATNAAKNNWVLKGVPKSGVSGEIGEDPQDPANGLVRGE